MSRLKLKRFKVKPLAPNVQDQYVRIYHSADLHAAPETLPLLTPESLFGVDTPLIFDLGAGRGDWLITQAAQNPELRYVGIELHWKSVCDAVHKAAAAKLDNVRLVKADLRWMLPKIPDAVATDIYMLFPPPRVEARELKSDLLSESILRHIHRMLTAGGRFHFVTDHEAYFEWKLALIRDSGLFTDIQTSSLIEGGITWFQKLWESNQIESRRLECRKV
ncbi:MAG TPA: hypothetical protein VHP83_17480 [Aggregatilineaceae bacterium]|nr:hypothetical protein [Aggregatilineaceae bacterium]